MGTKMNGELKEVHFIANVYAIGPINMRSYREQIKAVLLDFLCDDVVHLIVTFTSYPYCDSCYEPWLAILPTNFDRISYFCEYCTQYVCQFCKPIHIKKSEVHFDETHQYKAYL